MLTFLRGWLFSPAFARAEIHIEGSRLALKTGSRLDRTVDLNVIPAYVPDCCTYVVEYHPRRAGEYEAIFQEGDRIFIRSRINPRHRYPVCWLPPAFVGRNLDRHIRMIDRKSVFLRAGMGVRPDA